MIESPRHVAAELEMAAELRRKTFIAAAAFRADPPGSL